MKSNSEQNFRIQLQRDQHSRPPAGIVFGDGTGTLFRFAVDDGTSGIEVSPWTAVDWLGWRTVTWDLDADGFGSWIGNGAWNSPTSLRMESLQLGYDGSSPRFGALVVDEGRYRVLSIPRLQGDRGGTPWVFRKHVEGGGRKRAPRVRAMVSCRSTVRTTKRGNGETSAAAGGPTR